MGRIAHIVDHGPGRQSESDEMKFPNTRWKHALLAGSLVLVPGISLAQSCDVDLDAVNARIAAYEEHYGEVRPDIDCAEPGNAAARRRWNDE